MGVFSQILDVDGRVAARRATPRVVATGRARPQRRVRDVWQPIERPKRPSSQDAATSPFAPVRGVTLELFADIARAVASRHDGAARGTELAAGCGISTTDWLYACRVWNTRIAENPDVAKKLSALYRSDPGETRAS